MGVVALFFYVGAEVVAVDTLINYGLSLGFNINVARFFSSFTLIAMIVGYLVGIITIPKYISQQKALRYFALLGILFTLIAVFTHGYASVLFVAPLGFANSIMWSAIWPLADGLGKFTKRASAILIMAIAGGATIPLLYWLPRRTSGGGKYTRLFYLDSLLFSGLLPEVIKPVSITHNHVYKVRNLN